jgi:predicted transposase YbfD/YdcC
MAADNDLSLLHHFQDLPDPRVDRTRRHDLLDVVAIALCAVIAGAESWPAVEAFGKAKHDWLKQFLRLQGGIPSHDTFGRVFAALDPEALQGCLVGWLRAASAALGLGQVAIDGKALRRSFDRARCKSCLHLVSAWAAEAQLTLGQVAVDDKSNEITAIPRLLELLDVAGAVVTIDAMGCQKEIAQKVLDEGADYVLAVKDNQPRLYEDLIDCFERHLEGQPAGAEALECEEVDKGHGRTERRTYTVIHGPQGVRDLSLWPGLSSICMAVRERTTDKGTSVEASYYVGSREAPKALDYARWVRGHWGIENGLHWVLDVTFREDDCRLREGHGPQNLALLRRVAVSLLKGDKGSKDSIQTKRLRAGWDESYLLRLLTGFPSD